GGGRLGAGLGPRRGHGQTFCRIGFLVPRSSDLPALFRLSPTGGRNQPSVTPTLGCRASETLEETVNPICGNQRKKRKRTLAETRGRLGAALILAAALALTEAGPAVARGSKS